MIVRIDEDLCSQCGSCTEICPEIFLMEDDRVIVKNRRKAGTTTIRRGMPGSCRYVSNGGDCN